MSWTAPVAAQLVVEGTNRVRVAEAAEFACDAWRAAGIDRQRRTQRVTIEPGDFVVVRDNVDGYLRNRYQLAILRTALDNLAEPTVVVVVHQHPYTSERDRERADFWSDVVGPVAVHETNGFGILNRVAEWRRGSDRCVVIDDPAFRVNYDKLFFAVHGFDDRCDRRTTIVAFGETSVPPSIACRADHRFLRFKKAKYWTKAVTTTKNGLRRRTVIPLRSLVWTSKRGSA